MPRSAFQQVQPGSRRCIRSLRPFSCFNESTLAMQGLKAPSLLPTAAVRPFRALPAHHSRGSAACSSRSRHSGRRTPTAEYRKGGKESEQASG